MEDGGKDAAEEARDQGWNVRNQCVSQILHGVAPEDMQTHLHEALLSSGLRSVGSASLPSDIGLSAAMFVLLDKRVLQVHLHLYGMANQIAITQSNVAGGDGDQRQCEGSVQLRRYPWLCNSLRAYRRCDLLQWHGRIPTAEERRCVSMLFRSEMA